MSKWAIVVGLAVLSLAAGCAAGDETSEDVGSGASYVKSGGCRAGQAEPKGYILADEENPEVDPPKCADEEPSKSATDAGCDVDPESGECVAAEE